MFKAITILSLALGVIGLATGAVVGLLGVLFAPVAADIGATGATFYWLLALLLPAGLYVALFSLRDDDDFETVFDRPSALPLMLAIVAALGGALATATYIVALSIVPTVIANLDPLVIRQSFAAHGGPLAWLAVWAISIVLSVLAGTRLRL